LLSLSFVSAGWFSDFFKTGKVVDDVSVSDTLSELVNSVNSYEDISIVYGDNAAIEDLFGAFMISDIFPMFDEDQGRGSYVKKVSEVTSFQNKNLILVGGPCANQISEDITNEGGYNCADWKFDVGESLVKVFDNGDGKVIMIAGTTKGDTWKMSDAIRRYDKSEKLKSSDEVIFDTPVESMCGNDICEIKETDENCPEDCSNEGSIQLTFNLGVTSLDISGENLVFDAVERDETSEISNSIFPEGVTESYVYLQNLETKDLKQIGQGSWPQIDGDYIAYMGKEEVLNERAGNYVEWPVIKLYRISTGETITLTEAKIRYYFEWPIISGNNVVWLERNEVYEDTNPPKLMIYNTETKLTKKLVDVRYYWDSNFKIYGDKIVYQGPKYCVPEDCSKVRTEVSSNYFVYENAEEGDEDVWLYDMSTKEKTRITSDEEYQGMPEIWNNYIVWVDDRLIAEGKKEIYLYNLLTTEEKPLNLTYAVSGGYSAISFSDYNVIWTDNRNGNGDVYFYDVERDIERRITLNSNHQGGGKLDGNYVVWIDHRNGGQDLFMLELA